LESVTTRIDDLRGRRVYLDANVLICFLDGASGQTPQATLTMQAAADGVFRAVTGDAAVAEVMVGPYRAGNQLMIRTVKEFFRQPRLLEVTAHSAQTFDDAAMLRATQTLPFIDALHLATAAAARCDALITNDRRLKSALGVEVIALRSIALVS